jgi:dihydroxy-acid dehydratase
MVRIMKKLYGQGKALTTAVVTDGRFSGSNNGCFVGHISPEAASGGPIALVEDGDRISIDIPAGTITLDVPDEELRRRESAYKAGIGKHRETSQSGDAGTKRGYLARYAERVSSAAQGAVL